MTAFVPGGPKRYLHQKRALRRIIETRGVTALLMDPGTGKALDVDTEVPTPLGWTTMGALRTGDMVYAQDGSQTQIVAHEPYEAQAWRLTFSGGVEVVADADHLWQVDTRTPGGRWLPSAARTTREMIETLDVGGKRAHLVRMAEPVRAESVDLPVDPYVLGVWLGDGISANGGLSLGEKDAQHIIGRLLDAGEHPRITRTERGTTYVTLGADPDVDRYGHSGAGTNCPQCAHLYYRREKYGEEMVPVNVPLVERLRLLGVLGNKHVPPAYLRASIDQRLALLRGLVDTDGYCSRDGAVEVTLTREALAEAVREVVASLGERVTMTAGRATLNGRDAGPRWRIRWTPRLHRAATLPRRVVEPRTGSARLRGRYLERAEFVGVRRVRCLTVDSPTAQYLVTRSWLATHNTAVTLDYASLLALKSPRQEARVLVVAPLAAVDTWVSQARTFVSPQVSFWAEAVGGTIRQRAETLASRGGALPRTATPSKREAPRAQGVRRAWEWAARSLGAPIRAAEGPDALAGPRLVLEVLNVDTFASRSPVGGGTMADVLLDAVRRFDPDLVVVDESHKIKSANANASRLLGRIGRTVPRRLILTGTVMPHGPLDVFGQWRFLDPYAFGTRLADGSTKVSTIGTFTNRFAIKGGYMGYQVVGYRNLDDMQDVMARSAVVVHKADALDLPATTDAVVDVHLDPAERRAYDAMKDNLATSLASGALATATNRLTQMLRLRQITAGHLPDDQGNVVRLGSSKVQAIASLVNDTLAGEDRVVVFTYFTHEIADLSAALAGGDGVVEVIEGSTPTAQRQAIRARFGDRAANPGRIVLVAQVKTLSLAVNELVTASHAIFASLSQQRDDLIQARDRLNRIGQTRPITFWYAVAPQTVDEVILASHQQRTDLESAVLRHIKGSSI